MKTFTGDEDDGDGHPFYIDPIRQEKLAMKRQQMAWNKTE